MVMNGSQTILYRQRTQCRCVQTQRGKFRNDFDMKAVHVVSRIVSSSAKGEGRLRHGDHIFVLCFESIYMRITVEMVEGVLFHDSRYCSGEDTKKLIQ